MARSKEDPDRVTLGRLTATPMRERGTDEEGRRYWRIRTRDDRRTVRSLWATRATVEVVVGELLHRGIPESSRPSDHEAAPTVGRLLNRWVTAQETRCAAGEIAPRSLDNYRRSARHWLSELEEILVDRLTRELVEDTLREWRAAGVSPRTAKLAADVMAAAVHWGAPRGLCPALELRRLAPAEVRRDEHVNCSYTPLRRETDRVLEALPPGRDRDLVELLGLTGARVGEAAAMRVRDWDREHQALVVYGRDDRRSRRGKVLPRRWPVLGRLEVLLGRLAGDRAGEEDLIEGLPRDCSDLVRRALTEACEVAGVERYTAHGLRRLVAMELLEQPGSEARSVAELTGHSVMELLRSYVRPRQSRLRDLVRGAHGRSGSVIELRAQIAGTDDPE